MVIWFVLQQIIIFIFNFVFLSFVRRQNFQVILLLTFMLNIATHEEQQQQNNI